MNLTDQEIAKLMVTKSETEWNATCDEIKRGRDGEYPPDWYARIVLSGRMLSVQVNWCGNLKNENL